MTKFSDFVASCIFLFGSPAALPPKVYKGYWNEKNCFTASHMIVNT